jgi:glycosyltransferase involved in cell wall biosynthesis
MKRIRLAVITVRSALGEIGGAERLYSGLVNALNFDNVEAEEISLPSDESGFENILGSYLRFHELDLSGFDGVISTKAPSYLVRHPNHVCYLLHTMRVFYDMFEREFPSPWPELLDQRRFIHRLDTAALSPPSTRRIFVNGEEVRDRLIQYNGLDAIVLHHPLDHDRYRSGMGDEGYAFLASRLHRWKRLDLAIRAMEHVHTPIRLLIAGTGEDEAYFRGLAASSGRVVFLGRVSDEELVDLYGKARVATFTPLREDYGLVTIEAFRSGKPVITCTDSGTPARLVQDGVTGFVTPPDPAAIARALDYLYERPAVAREMGRRGEESISHIRWDALRARILFELGF